MVKRLWLVSFHDAKDRRPWTRLFKPGFGHCCALSYFADQERWVYFNPTRHGSTIALFRREEFGSRLDDLVGQSSGFLRFGQRYQRRDQPAVFYCVGAMKALLGIESRAWTPWQLYWDMVEMGAEVVKGPGALAARGDS